jgi:hypothetical protein
MRYDQMRHCLVGAQLPDCVCPRARRADRVGAVPDGLRTENGRDEPRTTVTVGTVVIRIAACEADGQHVVPSGQDAAETAEQRAARLLAVVRAGVVVCDAHPGLGAVGVALVRGLSVPLCATCLELDGTPLPATGAVGSGMTR